MRSPQSHTGKKMKKVFPFLFGAQRDFPPACRGSELQPTPSIGDGPPRRFCDCDAVSTPTRREVSNADGFMKKEMGIWLSDVDVVWTLWFCAALDKAALPPRRGPGLHVVPFDGSSETIPPLRRHTQGKFTNHDISEPNLCLDLFPLIKCNILSHART